MHEFWIRQYDVLYIPKLRKHGGWQHGIQNIWSCDCCFCSCHLMFLSLWVHISYCFWTHGLSKYTWMSTMIETWIKFMPIIETKVGILCILPFMWWNIVLDDWNLDWTSLDKQQYLQPCIYVVPFYYKEWHVM